MRNKLVVILLLSLMVALRLSYNEAVVFKLSNLVCESLDKSWITINECRLRAISRNKTTGNFNATFHQSVNNLSVTGQLFYKANGYKPWLYKATIDACRFRKKAYNPIAIIIFNQFKEFSNLDHPCPYEGIIFIKGAYPRLNLLPLSLPSGEYLLAMNWHSQNISKFITKIYFVFTEDL